MLIEKDVDDVLNIHRMVRKEDGRYFQDNISCVYVKEYQDISCDSWYAIITVNSSVCYKIQVRNPREFVLDFIKKDTRDDKLNKILD